MAQWKIEAVEVRSDDNAIVQAHWRYGTVYGSQAVEGLVAGEADEAAVIAAVKISMGEERVGQVEAAHQSSEEAAVLPATRTAPLSQVSKLVAQSAEDRLDRIALQKQTLAEREAFVLSRIALDNATKARDGALAARDSAVQARADAVKALESAQAALAAAVKSRDDAIAAGTTGAPLQALRDVLATATAARDAAVAARDSATADAAAKNSALDAATASLQTVRASHLTLRK